jgi:hypothetical protein
MIAGAGVAADDAPIPVADARALKEVVARPLEPGAKIPVFDDQLQIAEWNEVIVIFQGFSKFLGKNVSGSVDRMTGDVGMVATSKAEVVDYSLKCTPTHAGDEG